ncbi:tubulin binding cofactor C-domain-containing protein [Corynascus novoguineensis]|uniref:Tubulin binding cofactor C-domain-containing protein n=1 Tax=Corynascus novoguineensis TaxID=1126955 RepID=A0AAN7CXE2_9PEZI|nr:tubulin binding cofactor C-domain-containing protein [Corynascus novoguineensis]
MTTQDPKERFYRQFQVSVSNIQEQINQLSSFASVGPERQDAVDHILGGLSHLSKEVADATEFIPAHDQRIYSDTVKSLKDQLNEAQAKLMPKGRFQFKKRPENSSAATAKPDTRRLGLATNNNNNDNSHPVDLSAMRMEAKDTVNALPTSLSDLSSSSKNYNAEISRGGGATANGMGVRKPSFSAARDIDLSDHIRVHITLPASASRATSSGTLTDLHQCVVDMTLPTSSSAAGSGPGTPFASLALRDIRNSAIVAGHVDGPVHVTGVRDSVVMVIARQVRIHECRNVVFYLHCVSRPIVEDCTGVQFAKAPGIYLTDKEKTEANLYDQVDDFKWLKTFSSPNWSLLPDEQVVPDDVWKKALDGKPGTLIDDTLRMLGVGKSLGAGKES